MAAAKAEAEHGNEERAKFKKESREQVERPIKSSPKAKRKNEFVCAGK